LIYPATKKSPTGRVTFPSIVLALLGFVQALYIILHHAELQFRMERVAPVKNIEVILGLIAILVILEATRRAISPALAYCGLFSLVYYYFGHYLPGIFKHDVVTFPRLIENMYLLSDEGIYGMFTGVSSTFVYLLVLFGVFVYRAGTGGLLIDLSSSLMGRYSGGPAKIAVLGSCLFGMISGSSVANVYTSGSFTIPMMKKVGYKREFAAGVEAASSTGGQLMPPIMGAAIFIMAEWISVPYIKIAKASFIPALLFYFGILAQTHLEAKRNKLVGMPREEIPKFSKAFFQAHLFIPIAGLIYFLFRGYTPFTASFYAILMCVGVSLFRKDTRMTPKTILYALYEGAKGASSIAAAIVCSAIIMSVLVHTGLGVAFTSIVLTASMGSLFLGLTIIAIACIILGLALPATPTYMLVAAVCSPAMEQFGVPRMAAHLFIFYFGCLEAVTPPLAMCSFAAAQLAEADPMKVCWVGFKLAISGFIVPFLFVYHPPLLLKGNIWEVLIYSGMAFVGVALIAVALEGWFTDKLNIIWRLVSIVLGGLVMAAGSKFYFVSIPICILLGIYLIFIFLKKKQHRRKLQYSKLQAGS
jgi:TRAP transporter 4TM/12TM fusion protein